MSKLSKPSSSLCFLLLLVFVLLSSQPALSFRGPKLHPKSESAQTMRDDDSSAMVRIEPRKSMMDDSSSMVRIEPRKYMMDDSSAMVRIEPRKSMKDISSAMVRIEPRKSMTDDSSSTVRIEPRKSMIADFFGHKFPVRGWPFPKYPPFTMANPNIPTIPSGAQEESQKVPSSPSEGRKDGGHA